LATVIIGAIVTLVTAPKPGKPAVPVDGSSSMTIT
jgi:gas vesicle protein